MEITKMSTMIIGGAISQLIVQYQVPYTYKNKNGCNYNFNDDTIITNHVNNG